MRAAVLASLLCLAACRPPAPPVAVAAETARASVRQARTFCGVQMAKDDGRSYSAWLSWLDAGGEWRHRRLFSLGPGRASGHAVAEAVAGTEYWLILCDPAGSEVDDYVHVGLVAGTRDRPTPVAFGARDHRIVLLDGADGQGP